MEALKQKLVDEGIKPTFQRISILKYLEENSKHPTADMIYDFMRKKMPTISKTTVYNTVHTFLENGLINELTITGQESRYDINTHNHHHFLCRNCGKIYDVDIQCPHGLPGKDVVDGHKIDEIHGYFKGICQDCLRKNSS
ncbi:MAG: transcriptional repressor [Candidatus Marinimicrobia bacterium]|nr:transcriptional repressor [Candidatus Neomarinimicrobiota bacterium]